jgi:hypothetical protein
MGVSARMIHPFAGSTGFLAGKVFSSALLSLPYSEARYNKHWQGSRKKDAKDAK